MRGRKPIPSKIIELKGGKAHTHRPPRAGEPDYRAGLPKPPEHLDEGAVAEWKRAAREAKASGVLTKIDMAVFALYCQSYSVWATASAKVSESGMVLKGKFGPVVNPYFGIAMRAAEQMKAAMIEMGFTPSSRARVKATAKKPEKKAPEDKFFK